MAMQLLKIRRAVETEDSEMNQTLINGPWIVAQLIRIRTLENEVKDLLAKARTPNASLRSRVAHLKSQVALLDLALSE